MADNLPTITSIQNEPIILPTLRVEDLPAGANATVPQPAWVTLKTLQGNGVKKEDRTRILVPKNYQTKATFGSNTQGSKTGDLQNIQALANGSQLSGGIIFPYTPTITYDVKADYSAVNPTHSNYTQYFYQHSSVGVINISGKFTVQNQRDAVNYLATVHLLKALTKMTANGSPPPVCRLFSYGAYMIDNVPIVINTFRVDLPNDVDYYTMGKSADVNPNTNYNNAPISVPVSSTIAITCYPMYSRNEMLNFSVDNWLNNYRGTYL